jgi:hypothetical protein
VTVEVLMTLVLSIAVVVVLVVEVTRDVLLTVVIVLTGLRVVVVWAKPAVAHFPTAP